MLRESKLSRKCCKVNKNDKADALNVYRLLLARHDECIFCTMTGTNLMVRTAGMP